MPDCKSRMFPDDCWHIFLFESMRNDGEAQYHARFIDSKRLQKNISRFDVLTVIYAHLHHTSPKHVLC